MLKTTLLTLLALTASAAVKPDISIDSKNRVLRDSKGRHTIYHGVNVVYKVATYMPATEKFDA